MTTLMVAEVAGNATRDLSIEQSILGPDIEVRRFAWHGDTQALINACQNIDCILTDYVPFSAQVMEQLKHCQVISVAATGYGCVDVHAAARANISVCAIDEYCTDEVADHTLLLILSLARKLRAYDHHVQHEHRWHFDSVSGLLRLRDKTLGIIGYGRIGQAVAHRARAFGLRVIAYDPALHNDAYPAVLCSLASLLADSDIISLHCALSADNHHMINRDLFQQMKKSPMLVNVARGGLIHEQDLVDALDSGVISAAALDVLESESPNLEATGLLGRDNVVLTPHAAFYSDASIIDNRTISAQNIAHHINGEFDLVRHYIHHNKEVSK